MATPAELQAMRDALVLAADPSIRPGANPRVGCVLLTPAGARVAHGAHRGAGTPHAEVVALAAAGARARGATAVVTLEPCNHTGRTGPCTQALLAAGVARVVFGQPDVDPVAAGGARTLRSRGVAVEGGVLADEAEALNVEWAFAATARRPHVTWKYAATLDGRVAAADGTSRWITGPEARRDVHRLRSVADAVVVGTGTALVDDPQLSVRDDSGDPAPRGMQPLRVVIGRRQLPGTARVHDDTAPTLLLPTRDPHEALVALWDKGIRRVLLEGGPTLAGAFWRAGLVDRTIAYVAPALLGAGASALADAGVSTIDGAVRLSVTDVARLGADVRITAEPNHRRV